MKILALRLLDGFDKHISAQLMLLNYNNKSGFFGLGLFLKSGPKGFTGLHGAAFLGIVEILTTVFETKEWDVDASDSIQGASIALQFRAFLALAPGKISGRGDPGLNIATTVDGRTPLMWAAERGNEGVIKMLLDRGGADPDRAVSGWTPLLLAAQGGHEGVVKTLLGRDDVNFD